MSGTTIEGVVQTLEDIFPSVIALLFMIATFVFLWGVINYIGSAESEEKARDGRTYMIWGVVALFVMFAAWGLARVLINTFDISATDVPTGAGVL